jgi:pimeloyl-ACP methyl ester carboxylesterase
VTAPTLIVWGKDDALIPVGYASEFSDAIRGCRIEILRDCGHIPQAEQLEATLAVVRRFLENG